MNLENRINKRGFLNGLSRKAMPYVIAGSMFLAACAPKSDGGSSSSSSPQPQPEPTPEPTIEEQVATDAADRIMRLQNSNGSWDWIVTDKTGPTETTHLNIAGVTGEVLVDAFNRTGEQKYLDAAKKTGDYLINQIGDPQPSQRQNAFNMVFLHHLTEASDEVKYKDQANAMLTHVLDEENNFSNNFGSHCSDDGLDGCTASELMDALKNYRDNFSDPSGIVPWDLHTFIEAAQKSGRNTFANNMANEIDNYVGQSGFDSSIDYYNLGLSATVLGLTKTNVGYSDHLDNLVNAQNPNGSFSDSIQNTAYGLMALRAAEKDAEAEDAASYLVNNFGYSGLSGWLEGDDAEYSEVTSEAGQALFDYSNNNLSLMKDDMSKELQSGHNKDYRVRTNTSQNPVNPN